LDDETLEDYTVLIKGMYKDRKLQAWWESLEVRDKITGKIYNIKAWMWNKSHEERFSTWSKVPYRAR